MKIKIKIYFKNNVYDLTAQKKSYLKLFTLLLKYYTKVKSFIL